MNEYEQIVNEFIFLNEDYNFIKYEQYFRYGRYYSTWKKDNYEIIVGYSNRKRSYPTIEIIEHDPLTIFRYQEDSNTIEKNPEKRLHKAAEWLKEYMKDKTI